MFACASGFVSAAIAAAAQVARGAKNTADMAAFIAAEVVVNPVLNLVLPTSALPTLGEEEKIDGDGDVDPEWEEDKEFFKGLILSIEESKAFNKARKEQREAQERRNKSRFVYRRRHPIGVPSIDLSLP